MWWAVKRGDNEFTLTEWGRGVGLRRTPYLARMAKTLVNWGVVEKIPHSLEVNGLSTAAYRVAQRDIQFFYDVENELLDAYMAERTEY
jgi:hypothetical protein